MQAEKSVHRVAIVGTGTIEASWATHYLARGFDVVATDPAPGAEGALRAYVHEAWDTATALRVAAGASRDRLCFTADMREAVADADFVQEAPERPELKVKLFAESGDATATGAIIASTSAGNTMSEIQAACRHPERTVIGHPFNPPHLTPLVEVVGGSKTAAETILRWGVMGPSLVWHLGRRRGRHSALRHVDGPMQRVWASLGNPELTPELKQKIIDGVLAEADGHSIEDLAAQREAMLLGLEAVRAKYGGTDRQGAASTQAG